MMNNEIYDQYLENPDRAPLFGQALIRDVVLPDILGDDVDNIAYWEGKQLARRFQLGNIEDLSRFFQQAAFGTLQLTTQTAKEWQFSLSGAPVASRLAYNLQAPFMLEAGFLAQTVEQMIGVVAETKTPLATPKTPTDAITLSVHLDPQDAIADPAELTPMTLIVPDQPDSTDLPTE
ncbi:YslB family protein [uncultured Secundilactobacillus sp.]|uniref:YslB family protein n=1 Tax=uncultured Secundilactobacillus sp. TaxID=2813935 RepID=UPI0025851A85|nr:YslB family protein [uncultured Secundilactobacillus sp.]